MNRDIRKVVVSTAVMLCYSALLGTAPSFAAKKTLTLGLWRNDAITAKNTQAILDAYSKKNDVNVKMIYAPWGSFLDKLLAMAAAGQIPDVIVVERRWLPRFAENRIVRPLDDVVATEKFDPKARLSEKKSGFYRNKFYGFPIWGGPAMHYYNPAMFKNSGIPEPAQLMASGKWDWDGFLDVARKLTKDTTGDGKPDVFALEGVSTWSPDWVSKIRQNGGDVFDENYKKVLINEPAAIEGLQYWADLSLKHNVAPKAGQNGSFEAKKSAIRGGWLSEAVTWKNQYSKKGIDMQLALYPAGKAGYITLAGGCPVGVSASTKNFKEAYKFAKWFAMESNEWKNTGTPASKATYEGPYQEYLSTFFENPGPIIRKAVENTDPEPSIHPSHQLIEEALFGTLAPVLTGKYSPAQATTKLKAQLESIINRKK